MLRIPTRGGGIGYKYVEAQGMLDLADYISRAGGREIDINNMMQHILWLQDKATSSPFPEAQKR